jgi:hypothetical protein
VRTARRQRRSLGGPLARVGLLLLALAGFIVVLVLATGRSASAPGRGLESMFQDDAVLVDNDSTVSVERALDTLKGLGVDRLRITVTWAQIAPDPVSGTRPRFEASDPAAYPDTMADGWARFDRIDLLAHDRGIAVDFDVSDPAPLWATEPGVAKGTVLGDHAPSAQEFGQFVTAVGERYSGRYKISVSPGSPKVALPRVSFWTIWNEPNQPGWLAPQYHRVDGTRRLFAPELYREYVDQAWAALHATGHGHDRILVGDLAPEGCTPGGQGNCAIYKKAERPIAPIPFLQALYCVNASYQRLHGAVATALGCPPSGGRAAFVRQNPALFHASAFTHHPYNFLVAPGVSDAGDPTFVPLANLGRLEAALDRSFVAYGSQRKLPLYLDEYGYETNPPNPFDGVPLTAQARYLDQATYLAWKDPRVEGISQFLLVDSAPDALYPKGSPRYWSTFQTGLEFADGRHKPSFAAYRLPVFLPHPTEVAGSTVLVWAMLRLALNHGTQRALIQWRPSGGSAFATVGRVTTTNPDGVFEVRVAVPHSGVIRVRWTSPGGQAYLSRPARVTVTVG